VKPLSRYFAEAIGTFAVVFAGTGAIIVNDITGGVITHVGIALTFGLIVTAMIFALGDISGAHFNPAVTLAFLAVRRISPFEAGIYCVSQCLGALSASFLLQWLFPNHPTLGATLPTMGIGIAVVFELVLTFLLMFVIINVATGSKEKGLMAALAIGATVALDALFGGPISGASMNPARSLGPAVVSLNLNGLWIYWTAPIIGALLAVGAWHLITRR